jgi:hypothetical protein
MKKYYLIIVLLISQISIGRDISISSQIEGNATCYYTWYLTSQNSTKPISISCIDNRVAGLLKDILYELKKSGSKKIKEDTKNFFYNPN